MSKPKPTDNVVSQQSSAMTTTDEMNRREVERSLRHVTQETNLSQCPSNLDLRRPDHKAIAFNAAVGQDLRVDPGKALEVMVRYWILFPDESFNPETGEVTPIVRLALITTDGRVFRTASVYAVKWMRQALSIYGPEEWAKGIPFAIFERRLPNGHTAHDLRVLMPPVS